ncbi:EF-hand domain-containing protein [Sphingomonas sp. BIUV-7]|uniref:EF-hand domain-containing protein n=1 Tax=Sphingomonas natans TaxID=3063330 RepID=A0ABT8YEZ9_9SPHN|nr:EF-hand domain-containing protein [Sphingomonas sp. BIUV-7]MDO6416918.1 EF-hand domain-containing protein [Sphingomonas sp. BIUV-7]
MWRYLVGAVAALLLAGGGLLIWRGGADARSGLPDVPLAARSAAGRDEAVPEPPAASEKTREERRFSRYDKDKDGQVAREEYLASRRKAFARLDANGDGRLDFDEWAIKTTTKFVAADADHDAKLTPVEFAVTKVARKTAPRIACPPATAAKDDEET